jgi:fluoroquinolone transport system permease protein
VSLRAAAALDLRLQWRHGFYAAYLFVVISYIVLLRALPPSARAVALPPVLLTEATVIGFFFAGVMLQFERGDGVLEALAVTPLEPRDWLVARTLTLSMLTGLACAAVGLGALPGEVRPVLLGVAGALTAAVFAPLGLAAAARLVTIERFVVGGGLASAALGLPVLPYLGIAQSPLWRALPTDAAVRLLAAGTGHPVTAPAVAVSVALLLAWLVAALTFSRRWVVRHAFGRSSGR